MPTFTPSPLRLARWTAAVAAGALVAGAALASGAATAGPIPGVETPPVTLPDLPPEAEPVERVLGPADYQLCTSVASAYLVAATGVGAATALSGVAFSVIPVPLPVPTAPTAYVPILTIPIGLLCNAAPFPVQPTSCPNEASAQLTALGVTPPDPAGAVADTLDQAAAETGTPAQGDQLRTQLGCTRPA